jgi:hypothetical protein
MVTKSAAADAGMIEAAIDKQLAIATIASFADFMVASLLKREHPDTTTPLAKGGARERPPRRLMSVSYQPFILVIHHQIVL